jgi:hypothetical protein
MSGWVKIGIDFIKTLASQWRGRGRSHPNMPGETDSSTAAEGFVSGADSIAVHPAREPDQHKTADSPNQQNSSVMTVAQRPKPWCPAPIALRSNPRARSVPSKNSSVAAKLCDIFSMIFGRPLTISR